MNTPTAATAPTATLSRSLPGKQPRLSSYRLSQWLPSGRSMVIAVPYLFLLLFFMLPFLIVFKISLADSRMGVPPYTELWQVVGSKVQIKLSLESYLAVLADDFYFNSYVTSLRVALVTTLLCLVLGYPAALFISRVKAPMRDILLMGVILPFWTSYLVRIYAWIGILKDEGLANRFLIWLGVIDSPVHLMLNSFGLYMGMVYSYLPYMILPLYGYLVKLNPTLNEAASDLGAKPWRIFLTITLPLSMPAIIAGSLLVFIPSVGEYVIPELLGSADDLMIGRVMWSDFFNSIAWPIAAATTCVMVALLLVPMVWFQRIQSKEKISI